MIEKIWSLLNYLCVGMLYLQDNVILARNLRMGDFKSNIVGHWGTCPGVNAIYAHLMNYCHRNTGLNKTVKLVISTGHAAPSLLAAGFLDGTLQKYYPEYSRDEVGIKKLFNAYGSAFSSEIDVKYPGNIYCGGELGSGLAFSQGYVFNHPERIVVCIIGDGEFETPVCQASFQGFGLMDRQKDGRVIPVINLNGFKMGSKSTLAEKTDEEITNFFGFFGLTTYFANDSHEIIAHAFEQCFKAIELGEFPVLILKTPKGWSAPKVMGGISFEGSYKSHKPVLRNPDCDSTEFEEVKNWLESYNIDRFFSGTRISSRITDFLDTVGESVIDFERKHCIKPDSVISENHFDSNPIACCSVLSNHADVIIFSPDELDSNGLGYLRESCRIIELLSEQTCFGWSQGYAAGGGRPVLVTYESFAPLFDSMADQYLKSVETMDYLGYAMPAVNIIITSLGWNNVPSHHNPGFADRLMGYKANFISLLFPLSPSKTERFLEECLSTTNRLNVIIMDKRRLPVLYENAICQADGFCILRDSVVKKRYILIIVIGDIVAEEVLKAYDLLPTNKTIRLKIVGIEAPLAILNNSISVLKNSTYNVWIYNGRKSAVESLLWQYHLSPDKNVVMGYEGKASMPSGKARLHENQVDSLSLAEKIELILNMVEE